MITIPIWIHDGKTPPPNADIYYILAREGTFMRKKRKGMWDVIIKVPSISVLEEIGSPAASVSFPPIPTELTQAMARFFAWVYMEHGTEAVVLLFFDKTTRTYRVVVPSQQVAPQKIPYYNSRYSELRANPDEIPIGTFHSHGYMTAFHSSTDMCDEKNLSGVHGTFGKFTNSRYSQQFELSVQLAVNGERFTLVPHEMMDGLESHSSSYNFYSPLYATDAPKKKEAKAIPLNQEVPPQEIIGKPIGREGRYGYGRAGSLYVLKGGAPLLPPDYEPPYEWASAINTEMQKFLKQMMLLYDQVCKSPLLKEIEGALPMILVVDDPVEEILLAETQKEEFTVKTKGSAKPLFSKDFQEATKKGE